MPKDTEESIVSDAPSFEEDAPLRLLDSDIMAMPEPKPHELIAIDKAQTENGALHAWSNRYFNHTILDSNEERDAILTYQRAFNSYRNILTGSLGIVDLIAFHAKTLAARSNSSSRLLCWFRNVEAVTSSVDQVYTEIKQHNADNNLQGIVDEQWCRNLLKPWDIRLSLLEQCWDEFIEQKSPALHCSYQDKGANLNKTIESKLALSPKRYETLLKRASRCRAECRRIQEYMLKHNFKHIRSIANSYYSKLPNCYSDLADLMTVGALGLLTALERFDLKRECKFYTYTYWWIRQAIRKEIESTRRGIRLPVYVNEKVIQAYRALSALEQEDSCEYSLDDLPEDALQNLSREILRQVSAKVASLDLSKDEEHEPLYNNIPDANQKPAPDIIDEHSRAKYVRDAVASLPSERQRRVLELRYGLYDGTPHTLEEIGQIYGVTRERIRQIEAKALRVLRSPVRLKHLCLTEEDIV